VFRALNKLAARSVHRAGALVAHLPSWAVLSRLSRGVLTVKTVGSMRSISTSWSESVSAVSLA